MMFLRSVPLKKLELIGEVLLIFVLFFLVYLVNKTNYADPDTMVRTDMGNEWDDAGRLVKGINPYERILGGNLIQNDKYSTLFPLYYYFLSIVSIPSGTNFNLFVANYRVIIQAFEYVAFIFLYLIFRQRGQKLFGLFAAAFFIFNRWTVLNISVLKQDIVAINFLLASLYLFDKKIRTSYLLYGISLGIKHLGIFVFPVYLMPMILRKRSVKDFLTDLSVLLAPILLPSVYFLINNFKAFIYSMMFSFTRKPASSCGAAPTGYERLLVNYSHMGTGIAMFYLTLPRLPMVLFTFFNTVIFLARKIPATIYLVMAYTIFAALNPVYFDQYIMWVIPFGVLAGARDFLKT